MYSRVVLRHFERVFQFVPITMTLRDNIFGRQGFLLKICRQIQLTELLRNIDYYFLQYALNFRLHIQGCAKVQFNTIFSEIKNVIFFVEK